MQLPAILPKFVSTDRPLRQLDCNCLTNESAESIPQVQPSIYSETSVLVASGWQTEAASPWTGGAQLRGW